MFLVSATGVSDTKGSSGLIPMPDICQHIFREGGNSRGSWIRKHSTGDDLLRNWCYHGTFLRLLKSKSKTGFFKMSAKFYLLKITERLLLRLQLWASGHLGWLILSSRFVWVFNLEPCFFEPNSNYFILKPKRAFKKLVGLLLFRQRLFRIDVISSVSLNLGPGLRAPPAVLSKAFSWWE